jgi:hypothetical protein
MIIRYFGELSVILHPKLAVKTNFRQLNTYQSNQYNSKAR